MQRQKFPAPIQCPFCQQQSRTLSCTPENIRRLLLFGCSMGGVAKLFSLSVSTIQRKLGKRLKATNRYISDTRWKTQMTSVEQRKLGTKILAGANPDWTPSQYSLKYNVSIPVAEAILARFDIPHRAGGPRPSPIAMIREEQFRKKELAVAKQGLKREIKEAKESHPWYGHGAP